MFKKIKQFFEGGPTGIIIFVVGFVFLLMTLSWLIDQSSVPSLLSHSEFIKALDSGTIKQIKVEDGKVYGRLNDNKVFEATVHITEKIWDTINSKGIDVVIGSNSQSSSNFEWWHIVLALLVITIIVGIIVALRKSKGSGGGGGSSIFSFGKSRFKKVVPGEITVKFDDVAGAKAAKEALKDIVEYLKDPEKFKLLGARVPKGILLSGEAGNGKTLLARAVAGEANCNFLTISGADFIEVFVGVGASRVRDLFNQARKNTPCILFIDEIDAIGRSRGSGFGGGHDEREQTLNQLLTEMDGFDQYEKPLIVMAATNIPEVLDRALLRPGRFDRVVHVPFPDFEARLELFKIHTRTKPLAENVSLEEIAGFTQGLSGADIENLVNIAALKASQENRSSLEKSDFEKGYKDMTDSKRDIQARSQDQVKEFLPQQVKTKFDSVAGLENAKDDLREIVDFLKNPEKYKKMGARIPKGVIFFGDPGNGKTLLARALAGESGVPFFYASGSQFIQKYVGVGAERIRELFNQARKHSPSIIFIDEIDSIGKRRTDGNGGDSEYNQTINQLLTEMDGFIQDEVPVIVVAATNLKENIDRALLRPGRFDRQIDIPYPNIKARKKILNVHAKGKKFDETVDLDYLARNTARFSGAQLEHLLNEAAILAVSKKKDIISSREIEESRDRIIMGRANKDLTHVEGEVEKIAYHEAGHALMKVLLPNYQAKLHKVTILARGGSLGAAFTIYEHDFNGETKENIEAEIQVCLAGRAAEYIQFNHIHSGAVQDFRNATQCAQKMIYYYGMGERTGLVSFDQHRNISQETQREIDLEIKNILDRCYVITCDILRKHKDKLDAIAHALLEKETLSAQEVYDLAGVTKHEMKIVEPKEDEASKE
jgi:ATP-dependent metalloprotease FtsH